jgi:hypothetical protein
MKHFNLIDNISRIQNYRLTTIYHKSPYALGKSFKYKDRRKLEGTHINSALGLWGLRNDSYGRDDDTYKTYTFTLKDNTNIYGMAYHMFKNLTQDMSEEEILKLRKKLIKIEVDVLCVLDEDSIAEIIVINDEVIENFVKVV